MTKNTGKIPQTKNLKKSFSLSKEGKNKVKKSRKNLQDIISGKSDKKILIIGPCSADFETSIYEYAKFLGYLKDKYSDKIEIVMRYYTGKPRSTIGWKGRLHSEPGQKNDLKKGIKLSRKTAINLIEKYNLNLADELLYPELSSRLWDLYSYMAIGARSTENQFHREVASGLAFPIGIKNPCSGDIITMNNGVLASSKPSEYILERNIFKTPGNKFAHGILRGGRNSPNYLEAKTIDCPIIVDCNHDNSGKKPEKQIEIMKEVMSYKNENIKGFMVESYLYDGRQDYKEGLKKGLSLTDPCIGKENTEKLIKQLYDLI